MGKTAALVLLKLFINSNECCHITDANLTEARYSLFFKQHKSIIHKHNLLRVLALY